MLLLVLILINGQPGSSSSSITVSSPGTYRVTVTTADGCEATDTKQINGSSPEIFATITNIQDVSCLPKTDGSFTVVPSGGRPGYTYTWETGAGTSPNITGLGAGMHTVTVTDNNGCFIEKEVEIGGTTTVSMGVFAKGETCKGRGDGQITVTASGSGSLQYSIDGNNFQSDNSFKDLLPGDYRILVVDNSGCGNEQKETVNGGTRFTLRNSLVTQAKCQGEGAGGQVLLRPEGGATPYTVSFDGGPFERKLVFSELKGGTYNIIIRDASGCEKAFEQLIEEGSDMKVTFDTIPATCEGINDGVVMFTIEDGSGNISFNKIESDGVLRPRPSPIYDDLAVGWHNVLVRDNEFDCRIPIDFEITAKTPLSTNIIAPTPCGDGQLATITVQAETGVPPFQYSLDNGPFGMDNMFTDLIPQSYIVTTQDANGCTKTDSVTFGMVSDFEITGIVPKAESCANYQDGRITIFTNSIDTVMYSLDGDNYTDNNVFSGLAAGDYTVFAKLGDCIDTDMVSITAATAITLTNVVPQIAKCEGEPDGQLTITVEGGTMPYQYQITGGSVQASNTFTNLVQGNYNITVIDANSCKQTFSNIALPGPFRLNVICEVLQEVTTNGGTDGSASLIIFGGAAPYGIQLEDAGFNNIVSADGTETLEKLPAGDYTVLITDNNDCTTTCDFTITQPQCSFSFTTNSTNATCFGYQDGTIALNLPAANEPYIISWSETNFNGQSTITGLSSGAYNVTVSTPLGCTDSSQITITEPVALTVKIITNNLIICEKDSTQLKLTSNYTSYLWSDNSTNAVTTIFEAGNYGLTVQDASGCMANDAININVIAQDTMYDNQFTCDENSVGTFIVEERGADGCIDMVFRTFQLARKDTTHLATTTCNPSEEGVLFNNLTNIFGCDSTIITTVNLLRRDSVNLTAISCDSDEIGTSYQILTNVVGCDSVLIIATSLNTNLETTQLIDYTCQPNDVRIDTLVMKTFAGCDSLVITDYQLLRRDSVNLTAISCDSDEVGTSYQILTNVVGCDSVLIIETSLNTNIETTQLIDYTCNPYEVRLDTLLMKTFAGCDSLVITDYQLLRRDSVNLTAISCDSDEVGISYQTVTNAVGCDSVLIIETTLNANIERTELIDYTCFPNEVRLDTVLMKTFAGCDSLVITDYQLLRRDTTNLTMMSCNSNEVGTSYQTLTNAVGCDSVLVLETTLDATVARTFITLFTCNNGEIGIDTIILNTFTGCDSLIITQTISNASVPTFLIATACNMANVRLDTFLMINQFLCDSLVIVNTTLAPTDFIPIANQSCNPLDTGLFVQNLINQYGCDSIIQTQTSLTAINECQLNFSINTDTLCWNENIGTAQIEISEGIPPFDYFFIENISRDTILSGMIVNDSEQIENIPVGNYSLLLINSQQISSEELIEIIQNKPLNITSEISDFSGYAISCEGETDGSIELKIEGGKAPYIYLWESGEQTDELTNLSAGAYAVSVTDAANCSQTASFDLNSSTELGIDYQLFSPNCLNESGGSLMINEVANSNGKAEYSLDGMLFQPIGDLPFTIDNLASGTYELYVQDENDCQASATFEIQQYIAPILTIGNEVNLNLGDSLNIVPKANFEIISYEWTANAPLPCSDCSNLQFTPIQNGTYTLTAFDANGCSTSATLSLRLKKESLVYLPNAFSPNGDGLNDVYQIYTGNSVAKLLNFRIYDYEGRLMYQVKNRAAKDPTVAWNGVFNGYKMLPAVFVVLAEVELIDGTTRDYSQTMTLVE